MNKIGRNTPEESKIIGKKFFRILFPKMTMFTEHNKSSINYSKYI